MKNVARNILISFFSLVIASIAWGAAIPPVNVEVSNSSGKNVFKGTTNASGTFTTGDLAAGQYVVQFTSKASGMKGAKFSIAVNAGKTSMSADSVTGEKLTSNGVAMKVNVSSNAKMTGQISTGGKSAGVTTAAAQDNRPGKMINGKKYIWVTPQTSNLEGGHWVEAGSAEDPANKKSSTYEQPIGHR